MLVLPLAWLVASCATYSGKPGSATVVDAATGRPLGGVVVAASWNYIDIRTGEFAGVFFMTDAVTDENGEFMLPEWGPRGITMGNSGRVPRALDYAEPHLHLFKAGFRYRVVTGPKPAIERLSGLHWHREPVRDAWWNNEVMPLEQSAGGVNEYARMLYTSMMPLENCNWVQSRAWRLPTSRKRAGSKVLSMPFRAKRLSACYRIRAPMPPARSRLTWIETASM